MEGGDFSGKQIDRYLLSSVLGSGAAGDIYQAVDVSLEDSPALAIKCVRESSHRRRWHQQIAEINNQHAVGRFPNVLKLRDAIEEDGYLFLVLPLCETDVFRAIWKEHVYWRNDELIQEVFIDILNGVVACHRMGIFHRDLKPENIMCNASGTKVQIGDFGLSTNHRVCKDGGCGTVAYMGPECWDEKGILYYADSADIWSLGVILFNMVTCRYPWEEARSRDKEYLAFRTQTNYFLRKYPISESLNELLSQIWHPNPLSRLSIPEIQRAILEIDSFYKPLRPSSADLLSFKGLRLVDSQQTCVALPEDEKKEKDAKSGKVKRQMRPKVEQV